MSLVSLLLWTTALVMSSLALARTMVGAAQMTSLNQETSLATRVASRTVETLRAVALAEAFARYNASTSDDPAAGASPGSGFAVRGLHPAPGDADGLPGEILFPVDPGDPTLLTETAAGGFPGQPLDLNLDGDATDTGLAAYRVLPVIVRVRWRTVGGGTRQAQIATVLGGP